MKEMLFNYGIQAIEANRHGVVTAEDVANALVAVDAYVKSR